MYSSKRQPDGLSEREVEIVRLLDESLSDREIADRLVMTVNTIKWYNRQIYSKLGVGSRIQAITRARSLGLLDSGEAGESTSRPTPPRHNLPVETTRFIGRKREVADIRRLVYTARLLTLTGPPGTGKTRLSIHVAWELTPSFPDGVYLVSLAPINDPALVGNAIAGAVDVAETPGQPVLETLKRALSDRQMLLVIDNFEHLLPAAPLISELLAATTRLRVLATSREALHLYGEHEYAVPLMELPDPQSTDTAGLAACESVALFVQRAAEVQPDFELTPENGLDIAKICVRLEGLPLAIELAAARVKLMPPKTLLARLNNRLDTLIGGPRDVPPRQQTLRRTIDWSYNLLSDEEKTLFARLAVFRGGRSLEAIEAVCQPGLPLDTLEGAESLLNKSLLFLQPVEADGEPRFLMLETIYEYAGEQLEASGESDALRRRHAAYFADLAEQAAPQLRQSRFRYWQARLEADYENLRAALEWSLGGGDIPTGLRLSAALRDYWIVSSHHYADGERWIRRALALAEPFAPGLRARVLCAAGLILFYSAQWDSRKEFLLEAAALAREAGDRHTLAWSLILAGGYSIGKGIAEYHDALHLTEQGLALFRELGDKPGMAQALNVIGELTRTNGDDDRAEAAYEECLRLVRETGELRREGMNLGNLGFIAMHREDIPRAEALFREALVKSYSLGHDRNLVITHVISLAGVIAAKGDLDWAARLFGAGEALLEPIGVSIAPGDQPEHERSLSYVRSRMDAATLEACWREGRAMSFEQVVQAALDLTSAGEA
jgi:predicted ATPase/DNA-binding CsgD family transcriptional regulator